MKHILKTSKDCNCRERISPEYAERYCPICFMGLSICNVCLMAERELSDYPECPGKPVLYRPVPKEPKEPSAMPINPLIKKLLQHKTKFNESRKKKNPNGRLDLPVGDYYGRVVSATLTETGKTPKDKAPCIVLKLVTMYVAKLADDSLDVGDKSFAGKPVRINFMLKHFSEKFTLQDTIDQLNYALQDLGYDTSVMALDESVMEEGDEYTLEQVLEDLTNVKPYVKFNVNESKKDASFKNANLRGSISVEDLSEVVGENPDEAMSDFEVESEETTEEYVDETATEGEGEPAEEPTEEEGEGESAEGEGEPADEDVEVETPPTPAKKPLQKPVGKTPAATPAVKKPAATPAKTVFKPTTTKTPPAPPKKLPPKKK